MSSKEALIKKLGSEEKYREFMREIAKKASKNRKGKWGFAHMKEHDPDRLRTLQSRGGKGGSTKGE